MVGRRPLVLGSVAVLVAVAFAVPSLQAGVLAGRVVLAGPMTAVPMDNKASALDYFTHNAMITGSVAAGVLTLGLTALLLLVVEMAALGAQIGILLARQPLLLVLASLLPHGIVELGSLVLAAASAIVPALTLLMRITPLRPSWRDAALSWAVLVSGALLLVLLAAFLEAHVTGRVVQMVSCVQ